MARSPKSNGVDLVDRKPAVKGDGSGAKYYVPTVGGYKESEFGILGKATGKARKRTPETIHSTQAETSSGTADKLESGSLDPQLAVSQTSNNSSNPNMLTDPTKQHGAGPEWTEVSAKKRDAGPEWDKDSAKKRGAGPEWDKDFAKKRDAGPEWAKDLAKKRGTGPKWAKDLAKKRDAGPEWDKDSAKKRDAGPEWDKDSAKKRDAGPEWDKDSAKKRVAGPKWAKDSAKKRDAGPEWDKKSAKKRDAGPEWTKDPAKKLSKDAGIIRTRSRLALAKKKMAPVEALTKDYSATGPGKPKRRRVPPKDVVNTFVNDLVSEFNRLAVDISVTQREGMKVEFSTPSQVLVVAFEAHELPFDKIVVKQHNAQVHETKKINATKPAQPQVSEFLVALNTFLGRKTVKRPADEEVSRNVPQRIALVQDHGTGSFAWNGARLTPSVASGRNDRVVLTAELFESNTQQSWLIKLIDSRQAVGGKQDAGEALSPAGIRRLLAPLLAGLDSAKNGDVGST